MNNLFKKALTLVTGDTQNNRTTSRPFKHLTERDLIRVESEIGRELFGAVPVGHRREFFCLDKHTWVWHEEWKNAVTGKPHILTTRYEVHPNGILKVQEGQPYSFVEGQELQHLTTATHLYYERVTREVYKRDPSTGHLLQQSPVTIKG